MNTHKTHADKGIQVDPTECPRDVSLSRTLPQIDSPRDHQALDISQSSDLTSAFHFPNSLGAYTYSDASLLDDSRYISDRPAVYSGRTAKYGQLGYSKPPHTPSVSLRIASLPETSPPYRIAQENTIRLVSMPEHLEVFRALSDEYPDYSECLNISLTSDGRSNLSNFPADPTLFARTPETPSPPSSPESIMIIGNDVRVPPAFLRTKPSIDDDNQGGWIPWKGSPPKPIPALHGPLSLPYARCPSGAEGTVVEGEDLTHMIWGLDSSGSQLGQGKSHSTSVNGHKTPRPTSSSQLYKQIPYQDHTAHSLRDQEVIDLSRPEFRTSLANNRVTVPHHQSSRAYPDTLEHPSKDARGRRTNVYEFVRRDSPIQLCPSSFGFVQSDAQTWNAGLGIGLWQCAHENGPFPFSESAFPRADSRESPLVLSRSMEPINPLHVYSTSHSLSVYDTEALRSYKQRSALPTPPDTGSPRWSPCFRQLHLTPASPDVRYEQNRSYIDVSRSGTSDSPAPYKGQEGLLFSVESESCSATDIVHGSEIHRMPVIYGTPDASSTNDSEVEGLDVVTQPLPNPRSSQGWPNTINGSTPPSPVSPDLRRNLSQQQPRSIPLARLIQRRLSSVIEEEPEIENTAPSEPSKYLTGSSPTISIATRKRDASLENEKGGSQGQERKADTSPSPTTCPPANNSKQTYKPPSHPSRRTSANPRNKTTKTQKSTTDEATTPTNRFGENKENDVLSQKANIRPKKSYRKKKYTKKQDVPAVVSN